jgi:hypothetical protein
MSLEDCLNRPFAQTQYLSAASRQELFRIKRKTHFFGVLGDDKRH